MKKLAIDGGSAAFPQGPPSWPPDDPEVEEAVSKTFRDGTWGKYEGHHRCRLESRLAEHHRTEFVRTCCSGTFAVELALRALRVTTDDEVLIAGYDFAGNFRAVERVGARPVLVDIDPTSWCLSVNGLTAAVSPRTRAVVVSHLHGGLADMAAICDVAHDLGLAVVEDACQVPGAIVQGKPAGSWGDVGTLSFGGSKLVTAGRGGAILTASAEIAQRAKIFCEQGNDAYPLSELQAAALLPQWEQLGRRNQIRADAVQFLRLKTEALATRGWSMTPPELPGSAASFYKLAWLLSEADAERRERLIQAFQAEGIGIDAGFRGFARRSRRRCRISGSLDASQHASRATLVLHHPILLQPQDSLQRLADTMLLVAERVAGDPEIAT